MKITVLGASGFIGKHLVRYLISDKSVSQIVLIGRAEEGIREFLTSEKCSFVNGDLLNLDSLQQSILEESVVINLVYLSTASMEQNLQGISNLLAACEELKVKKLIHLSTAVIVGKSKENLITEKSSLFPSNEYEVTKFKIEEKINSNSLIETIILRPTAVFGKGGMNLLKLYNDLKTQSLFKNYLKSCLYNKRKFNLVSVENVTSAIIFLTKIENLSKHETFIISDDGCWQNNFRYVEIFFKEHLSIKKYYFPRILIPSFMLSFILKLLRQSNTNPMRVYSSEKLIQLGWKREVGLVKSLEEFITKSFD